MRIINIRLSKTFAVKRVKVPEVLLMRLFISVSYDALGATLESRCTKFFTYSISLPLFLIGGIKPVP